ncbi:3-hydroxyisobutyrate dehydrogenase [Gallaecimonas kandeliae]|uniref:3-hydroxyisobutyrate dehydrogenase n=1 Tax=Gallaecimonas kandeliae TaxID=3029055 RepID=UPI002649AE58|nr:3-hydroxyisobutyrate dehydrogenase [Gallaecimonas kandeliae]WKE66843.1 3-hydroxyisobutyrate dehydrogenase [Gallaecimonas kandeliae]
MKIAFIGLGNMGGPMAKNLLKAGHEVMAVDLNTQAVAELVEAGASAGSADDAAQCEVVVSMLPAGRHVAGLYLGETGLLAKLAEGALVIDSSTIDAATAKKVHEAARVAGIDFVDAPVSGGTAGAAAGTLTFIVGGSDQAFERAKPVLDAMGANIFHAGGDGAGQVAKICNNMLLSVLMAGTCESLKLGMAHGLDPKVLSDIMKVSSGGNWVLEKYNPVPGVMENAPASKGYQGGFMSQLMSKDLELAMGAAGEVAAPVPMGALARSLYQMHNKKGNGTKDFSSLLALFEE